MRPTPIVGEIALAEWQAAGLLKPSVVKPLITTIEATLVIRQLGALAPDDQEALRQALAAIVG